MAYRESRDGSGIGTFVGFLVGVGVGMLFAARPGSETRRQIADLIQRGRKKGEELIGAGSEQLEDAKESVVSEGGKEPFYESGKYT